MFKSGKIPANNPNVAAAPQKNWPKTGLAILLVLVLAGSGFYLYHRNQLKTKRAAQPYAYTYKTLNSYTLAGEQAGSGMAFNKPEELKAPTKSAAKTSQASFNQSLSQAGKEVLISNMSVASVPISSPPTASYLKLLNQNLTNPKSPGYSSSLASLNTFVSQRLSPIYTISLSQAKVFSNSYIKNNAWAVDFTATAKSGVKNAPPSPSLQGEAILAVGKSTFYYYFVDAVDYNWQSNQKIWQEVINSLKIDQ